MRSAAESGSWHLQIGGKLPLSGVFRAALGNQHVTEEHMLVAGNESTNQPSEGRGRIITNPHLQVQGARATVREPLAAVLDVMRRECGVSNERLISSEVRIELDQDPHALIAQIRRTLQPGDYIVHLHLETPPLDTVVGELEAEGVGFPCGIITTTQVPQGVNLTHMSGDLPVTNGEPLIVHTGPTEKEDVSVTELSARALAHTLTEAGMEVQFNDWVTARQPVYVYGQKQKPPPVYISFMGLTLQVDPYRIPIQTTGVMVTVARMK